MYSLNPAVTEMLTRNRQIEMHRQAAQRRQPRPVPGGGRSFRKAAGWALVEIGLRLAVPHRTVVGPHRQSIRPHRASAPHRTSAPHRASPARASTGAGPLSR